jgi:carbamoyl-phosphate synthase small subunit
MKYTTRQSNPLLVMELFFMENQSISGTTFGEVCFNTGHGYQEIFTDPSYLDS